MKNSLIIISELICILFGSCSDTEHEGNMDNPAGQVNVTFSVTLPKPEDVNTNTRTGSAYTDTDIKNVDLLIFDQNREFINRIKVDQAALTMTETGVDFSIRLAATSDQRFIHLVANGRTPDGITDRLNFGDITLSMPEDTALPLLRTVMPDTGIDLLADVVPLVMWGHAEMDNVSVVSKVEDVKLLRAAACIQVKKGLVEAGNGLKDFTINQILVTGAPTQGNLVPAGYGEIVSIPSVPRPVPGNASWEVDKTESGSDAVLYVYERTCTSADYLGIIISASYKGEPCYYKVAIASPGQTPMNIIRNHRYILTVVKVNGPGYTDMNTAIISAPSNTLKVELTDDNEEFPYIVADGQYLMALSNNYFNLYGMPQGAIKLGIVYATRGLQPRVSVPTDCSWLTNLNAVPLGNNKYEITGIFHPLEESSVFTTLTLACDNLLQTVQVAYVPGISDNKDNDSYAIDLVDASYKNWTAKIVADDNQSFYLHPTVSSPADFSPSLGGLRGGVKELSSKFASHAYLHFAVGESGEVKIATSVNGAAMTRKIVIVQ